MSLPDCHGQQNLLNTRLCLCQHCGTWYPVKRPADPWVQLFSRLPVEKEKQIINETQPVG